MYLPKDPAMLLSVINTQLRDNYSSLDDLCDSCDVSKEDIESALSGIGYEYNPEQNQFK
ncbi:MAG: DUF4250 domain-containing protein [Saccharofermentans sp.]|nr:DUF4250 domain-containing protein [Saccharofermentans sp.]